MNAVHEGESINHNYIKWLFTTDTQIPQIGIFRNLWNRAYAAGDKNLCICGELIKTRTPFVKASLCPNLWKFVKFVAKNLFAYGEGEVLLFYKKKQTAC